MYVMNKYVSFLHWTLTGKHVDHYAAAPKLSDLACRSRANAAEGHVEGGHTGSDTGGHRKCEAYIDNDAPG